MLPKKTKSALFYLRHNPQLRLPNDAAVFLMLFRQTKTFSICSTSRDDFRFQTNAFIHTPRFFELSLLGRRVTTSPFSRPGDVVWLRRQLNDAHGHRSTSAH
jgi:hypothetical protein